ncbi:hypothetical protein Tco_0150459 [Tanacetum coccineum]
MFDELMSTHIDFSAFFMNCLKLRKITRAYLVGPVFNLLKGTCKSYVELEYNMEECYRALTDQLDWANHKGHKSLVDMSKPLPLQDKEGRLTIPVEFFFNNDLEYLKAGNKERSYSSSITNTSVARYTLEGIKDMIPTLWSPVIIAYDKDAALRISHWGPQCQQFDKAMINTVSKHKVFSTIRILSVVSVQVEKRSGYGYLKEIVVRRADQKLYKFKEGDFPDLHLDDIKDMLLLIAQNKLFNLDGDTEKDKRRTCIMLSKIDELLLKRRILRSLEVLVGGRKTEMDKRLMQRTVLASPLYVQKAFDNRCTYAGGAFSKDENIKVVNIRTSESYLSIHNDDGNPSIANIKQALWFLTLGWHLVEIHVTWAHLENDGVKDFVTTSECSRLKEDLESLTWRWRHGFKATPRQPLVILAAFKAFLRPQYPVVTDLNPCFNQVHYLGVIRLLVEVFTRAEHHSHIRRSDAYAGNPVKEILLNLNLPDHRGRIPTGREPGFLREKVNEIGSKATKVDTENE